MMFIYFLGVLVLSLYYGSFFPVPEIVNINTYNINVHFYYIFFGWAITVFSYYLYKFFHLHIKFFQNETYTAFIVREDDKFWNGSFFTNDGENYHPKFYFNHLQLEKDIEKIFSNAENLKKHIFIKIDPSTSIVENENDEETEE